LWTLSYVTWRIFHSDTFPQFIPSPLFCYIVHKIAIRFRHWSSRATPGTPASMPIYAAEVHNNSVSSHIIRLQSMGCDRFLNLLYCVIMDPQAVCWTPFISTYNDRN